MVTTNTYIGTVITLLVLAGIGFVPNAKDTHYCFSTNTSTFCDRLSSTSTTCYPTPAITTGKKTCTSKWVSIDRTKVVETNKITKTFVKANLPAGGIIQIEVINNTLTNNCVFNKKTCYVSEFSSK